MACLNQCWGRGRCDYGECACDPPYYGVDCSLRDGRIDVPRSMPIITAAPTLPRDASNRLGGIRPRIYVYELPPTFNVRMWTQKTEERDCTIRAYTDDNGTKFHMHAFGMEVMRMHMHGMHSMHIHHMHMHRMKCMYVRMPTAHACGGDGGDEYSSRCQGRLGMRWGWR